MTSEEVAAHADCADSAVIELSDKLDKTMTPTAARRRIIQEKTGVLFSDFFLSCLSNRVGIIHAPTNKKHPMERLVHYLQSQNDIKSVVLYDDLSRESSVTISKTRKKLSFKFDVYAYDPSSKAISHVAHKVCLDKEAMKKNLIRYEIQ